MLTKVIKHLNGEFTAIDELGRNVYITESISFIFEVIVHPETNSVRYRPVTYSEPEILKQVELFLLDKPYDKELLSRLVIRYGWMDKRLNKLSFLDMETFIKRIRDRELGTSTDRRKLTDLCKQLSLSNKLVKK